MTANQLTPEQIGLARIAILDYIHSLDCSKAYAMRHINQGRAPLAIQQALKHAWQKPRGFILTYGTIGHWEIARRDKGHCDPLPTRQKDYSVKPWHESVWLMRERNPKQKVPKLHKRLIEKYPGVSIHQLRQFYAFMNKEGSVQNAN